MSHRRVSNPRVFEQIRQLCPLNRKYPLRSVAVRNITQEASSKGIKQACDGEAHVNAVNELRTHFSKSRGLTKLGILDALRRCFPDSTVTQTPKSTGILKFAKAGQAQATLDTDVDHYASRTYKLPTDHAKGAGRLKYEVDFGRYNYRWKDRDFFIYVASYWESEYSQVQNHYVVYPRSQEDVINGRSKMADNLITAASQHLSKNRGRDMGI